MSTLAALVLLAGGLVLIVAGAELLLDGLLGAAARLGVSAFAVTVLVSGLELENLAAGIAANARGLPGAAAGTFLGGTTFLALGVAGIAALLAPIRSGLTGSALLWTAAAPLPLAILAADGQLSRLDGAILVLWFGVAILGLARSGRVALEPEQERRRRWPFAALLAGLAVLTVGGDLLARGLKGAIERLGVSQTVLGNTLVAASVEAEEVGRVVVPTRGGRGDLGLANVTATIAHFSALNAGVIALVKPLAINEPSRALHLPAAVAATWILCLAIRLSNGLRRRDGAVFLLLYAAYVAAAIIVG
jgi:cation:H+ antiporter